MIQTVAAECRSRTSGCYCEFVSEGREGRGSYTVQVDCSNRQMTSLPAELPNFTNELDVSGNDVRDKLQSFEYDKIMDCLFVFFTKAVDKFRSGDFIPQSAAQSSHRRFK